ASVLRCASHWANAHPPHASRMQLFNVLPYFYAHVCFTLFDIDFQQLTKLKFFTLFQLLLLYLVLY
ncbi:MAG: hypothetical protein NZ455_16825, partial [Bacteroidia bacterium]|nr:hypothetical protein [Bacteroidia bacterium]